MSNVTDITAEYLVEEMNKNPDMWEIIDVREEYEYQDAHIKGAKNIPMGRLKDEIDSIDWSKNVVFVCRSGGRSLEIAVEVAEMGYGVKNLLGGMIEFSKIAPELVEGNFTDY